MKERIQTIINHSNLTQSAFADLIGVQRSAVSHILSGRNNPGLDFLARILASFPDISGDWLITGKGDMLKRRQNRPTLPPQLFPPTATNEPEDPAPYITKKQETTPITETPKAENPQSTQPEIAPAVAIETQTSKADSRTIRKIVIFYTDNTFEAYHQP